jgi:hypothetical protein
MTDAMDGWMDGEKEKHSTFRELTMNSMRGSKRLMQELRNSILGCAYQTQCIIE